MFKIDISYVIILSPTKLFSSFLYLAKFLDRL